MKICVFGAGAVGGHLAARLASTGHEVSVVVREAAAEAIAKDGIEVKAGTQTIHGRVHVFTDALQAGPQDYVLITVKATAMGAVASTLPALLGPKTAVVFVVNGIPWWYGHGQHPCPELDFLDPGRAMASLLQEEQIIGAVAFSANNVEAPGKIINHSPTLNSLTLGELDGKATPRVEALATAVSETGFSAPVSRDIRRDVWTKLVSSNMAVMPVCCLVEQPMSILGRNSELLELCKAVVSEGLAVAAASGYSLDLSVDRLFDERRIHNPHKPSMLQDLEGGRPMEIDAVLVAVQRFARKGGIKTPHLDAITALLKQRAINAGLYTSPNSQAQLSTNLQQRNQP